MSKFIDIRNIDLLSFASCPIEMLFNDKEIAHGTGFIWKHGKNLKIITNWHNVTGINPFTGRNLSSNGSIPDQLRIHVAKRVAGSKNVYKDRFPIRVDLYEDFSSPNWQQHKSFSRDKIDIVSLDLPSNDMDDIISILDFGYEHLFNHVGSDVFIVGYPNNDYKMGMPPIWKRGSLASEPLLSWHDKPAFLIDAASRSGMSGSPIFRRVFGPATIVDADGSTTIKLQSVMTTDFIGIYSGHLSDMGEQLTIGIGWPRNLITDILEDPLAGTRG